MIMVALTLLAHTTASPLPMDTARVVDSTLIVEPIGVTLQIPPAWIDGRDRRVGAGPCGRVGRGPLAERILVDPAGFFRLLHATGEWDREYSAVVDSIMPFPALAAHLGPEPFGGGHCFADLQMRVYVTDGTVQEVRDRARGIGVATAKAFFPSAAAASVDSAGWNVERLRWNARYFDYGAQANVELYVRRIGNRLLVLAFMHAEMQAGPEADRDYILASVRQRK